MAVRLEYMTNEYNRTENSSAYSETYTGLLNEIDTFIASLQINSYTENKGYLTSIRKSQKGRRIMAGGQRKRSAAIHLRRCDVVNAD